MVVLVVLAVVVLVVVVLLPYAAAPHPTTPVPHPSPETPLGTCTVLPPPPETPSPPHPSPETSVDKCALLHKGVGAGVTAACWQLCSGSRSPKSQAADAARGRCPKK